MSRLTFVLVVVCALLAFAHVHANQQAAEESFAPAAFQTLEDIDSKGVEAAFAEVDSSAHSDADMDAEHEMEMEHESEGEAEMDSEVEGEADSEMEMEGEAEADSEADADADVDSEFDSVMLEAASERRQPWFRGQRQPINRHKRSGIKNIECLDGDCQRAAASPNVKVGSNPTAAPKKLSKLDLALAATKEEIMIRARELHKEKDWAKKVEKLIGEYQAKLNKVTTNIDHLRKQTKALLKKKKQIQNIQVQNKLKEKLSVATADLNRLQKQLAHIHTKENEFADTEKQLKDTMGALKNSLLKLKGQNAKKAAYEGIN